MLTADLIGSKTSCYEPEINGHLAPMRACELLLNGDTVCITICSRDGGNVAKIEKLIHIAVEPGKVCIRYCGENLKPDTAGSSTFWGSCYKSGEISDSDKPEIISAIARLMGTEEGRITGDTNNWLTGWAFVSKLENN